ncbi:MAG: hypothetical protein JSV09_07255 [Thermoplasmata archaeon]|nr:MAG: hypothetical protein JSV09_07255 [Thermoplasmata archaeon]
MNLEELPEKVKRDIEDQSLSILEIIKDDIIVIGGWAVRALAGEKHARYTLDIDGVVAEKKLPRIKMKLEKLGLEYRDSDWGLQFYQKYRPEIKITDKDVRKKVNQLELRIELTGPRIKEFQTYHYFEFSLRDYVTRKIPFHNKDSEVEVKVPPVVSNTAVKLGLPVDYKNNFDSAILLAICDVDKVIIAIKSNDDWNEMVLRRLPKQKGRVKDPGRLENLLLINAKIDIREYIRKLEYIEYNLK